MITTCLVGAGYISRVHAEALQAMRNVRVAAVVDPNQAAARSLAETFRIGQTFASVEEALAAGGFDVAHVLVPPDFHRDVALPLLGAGKSVLLEKPLGASVGECGELLDAAARSGATLGVNQNFVFHPAFARLRGALDRGLLGRPNFVDCIFNAPLRQLASRQFGHWMFQAPGNILLEQAVHPLSQIVALCGPVTDVRAPPSPSIEIAPGLPFHPSACVSLSCERLPAQLRFAVGQSFPFWQISVVCDDGVIVADMLANRVFRHARSRWLDAIDNIASGSFTAAGIVRDSSRNVADFALSKVRLKPRCDPFFQSMRGSFDAFYAALEAGRAPETDGRFGQGLVAACETIASQAFGAAPARARAAARQAAADAPCDVAILGGTGFIGTHTVERFVREGLRVSVMARSTAALPEIFGHENVRLHRGDIRDADAVGRAIGDAPVVVNLAHGGASGGFEAIRAAMVGGAETVARACLARGVRRLVHVGSIASLYLGPQPGKVTGATPPDPRAEQRADYARAKAICDRMLLEMHAREGLPVCILRPGVVVGAGSPALHSGLGFFNNEQHVIGWNAGANPLPFVLVADVAEAILAATRAEGAEGRCYNLAGDVRLSARDYVAELGRVLHRPLRFHPQSPTRLWLAEIGKWSIKRVGGRAVPLPARRDILSRGMVADLDCSDAKRDLNWRPVSDRSVFVENAILVHAA